MASITDTGPYTAAAGPRRKCGQGLTIWAEDGVCVILDERDGEVHAFSVPEMRRRRDSFIAELGTWDRAREGAPSNAARVGAIEKFFAIKRMVEAIAETVEDAVRQGDPSDEEVRKAKLRAFLRAKQAGQAEHRTSVDRQMEWLVYPNAGAPLVFGPAGAVQTLPGRHRPIAVTPPPKPEGYRRI